MKCSLGISNFLEEISRLSHSVFSSISLHWSLRKAFLSLLPILWISAFRWNYLSFSPLPFTSLFSLESLLNHFASLHFFSLRTVLITASCLMSQTSAHTSSGILSDEMAGWHHWLNKHESEWTPGVGDGQGGLACCDSWGHKESDMTEWLNWTELNPLKLFVTSTV